MAYSHFDKFKAFFLALNRSNYHPERMDPKIISPADKTYCFNWLLNKIPELKGKNNDELIKFLSDPKKAKACVVGNFSKEESVALTQTLEEKPIATEGVVYEQGQATTDQPASAAGSSGGGGMPSIPGMPSTSVPTMRFRTKPPVVDTPKPDVVKSYNIKSPSALRNFGSNLGSKINIGLNKGINKAISGINNFNPGGIGGGSRSVLGKIGRFGKGGGTTGGGSLISKAKGRGGLVFALSIIGFMMLTGMLAIGGTSSTGEAAPISSSVSSLDYTLPLKDPSVQPLDIRTQVKATFPGAKLEYWDKIVQQSQAAGFNPALALALWIEETGASQTTYIKNGGSEIPVNGSLSKGHLGCAPLGDQTIDESLTCLFKMAAVYGFTNDQFAKFMALYSGGPAGSPFSNNPNFPANIKLWYSRLVPSGIGALTAVVINAGDFNVDISALPSDYQQWAQEALNASTSIAPKFKDRLIAVGNTKVITTPGGSHTEGITVLIRTGYDVSFFKQIFIHELGHRIKGVAGTTSPTCNGQTIESVESEGYLTYYAEHATPAQVTSPACRSNDQITRSDEDFAESVSYYINNMGELNYGSGCLTYGSVNPFARGNRPAHKAYIQCLLGP